jgi:CheY-like chemotaxis protein
VTTASTGEDALRLLREAVLPFHLVLSDVCMPNMNGYNLIECIALEMDVPVISAPGPFVADKPWPCLLRRKPCDCQRS